MYSRCFDDFFQRRFKDKSKNDHHDTLDTICFPKLSAKLTTGAKFLVEILFTNIKYNILEKKNTNTSKTNTFLVSLKIKKNKSYKSRVKRLAILAAKLYYSTIYIVILNENTVYWFIHDIQFYTKTHSYLNRLSRVEVVTKWTTIAIGYNSKSLLNFGNGKTDEIFTNNYIIIVRTFCIGNI